MQKKMKVEADCDKDIMQKELRDETKYYNKLVESSVQNEDQFGRTVTPLSHTLQINSLSVDPLTLSLNSEFAAEKADNEITEDVLPAQKSNSVIPMRVVDRIASDNHSQARNKAKALKTDHGKQSFSAVKTTEKILMGFDRSLEPSLGFSLLPNRPNSPFFLKPLDISDELIKYDVNEYNMEGRRASSPGKEHKPYKQRKLSATSSNNSSCSRSSSTTEGASANVKVVVRVRPLNDNETRRGDKNIIEYPGNGIIWIETGMNETKPFTFNTLLNENCEQAQMFHECGIIDLLDKALNGFSCTAFAFGQTGSGKTYTITGSLEETTGSNSSLNELHGIVPRSFQYLFQAIKAHPAKAYRLKASFSEVYNEKVIDLLNPSNAYDSLPVRWSAVKGFYVDNLFLVECVTISDLMGVLIEGSDCRQVGSNALNDHSSRSHCMLTVYIDSEEDDYNEEADGFPFIKHGKISFVDLAGSERVKETKSNGEALTESNNINKSLLTLGNCISSLGDPKKRGNHVPYRESKLTKLLADSLGGDGFTLMIACISPSSRVLQDTMNTLRYANRAKNIKNKPALKLDPKEQLLQRVKREVKLLKAENSYFRKQLGVPCSDTEINMTPTQIKGDLTPNENGRNNSSKEITPTISSATVQLGVKNGYSDMLQEFMSENETLKAENMELHRSRATAQKQQEEMFRENERLTKKLEELGRVMLSTPISREHVHSWVSSQSLSRGCHISRQATEDRTKITQGSSDRIKEREFFRLPPVRQGSYPNYVNSSDCLLDVGDDIEHQKQESQTKKEHGINSPKHFSQPSIPYQHNNAVETMDNFAVTDLKKNDSVPNSKAITSTVTSRLSQFKSKETSGKHRKYYQPKSKRTRKKPENVATADKANGYAAQFAARSRRQHGACNDQPSATKDQPSASTDQPSASTDQRQQSALPTEYQTPFLQHTTTGEIYDRSYLTYPHMPIYGYRGDYGVQYPFMEMIPNSGYYDFNNNNNNLAMDLLVLSKQRRPGVPEKEQSQKQKKKR